MGPNTGHPVGGTIKAGGSGSSDSILDQTKNTIGREYDRGRDGAMLDALNPAMDAYPDRYDPLNLRNRANGFHNHLRINAIGRTVPLAVINSKTKAKDSTEDLYKDIKRMHWYFDKEYNAETKELRVYFKGEEEEYWSNIHLDIPIGVYDLRPEKGSRQQIVVTPR